MAKFIELHIYDDGTPFLVAVSSIQAVTLVRAHAVVASVGGDTQEVCETYAQVKELLLNAAQDH